MTVYRKCVSRFVRTFSILGFLLLAAVLVAACSGDSQSTGKRHPPIDLPPAVDIQKFSGERAGSILDMLGGPEGKKLNRPISQLEIIDLEEPEKRIDPSRAGNYTVVNAIFEPTRYFEGYILQLGVVGPAAAEKYRSDIEDRRTGLVDWGLDSDIILAKAVGRDPSRVPDEAQATLK